MRQTPLPSSPHRSAMGWGCKLLCGPRGCGWPHASERFPLFQLGEGEVKRVTAMHTAMQDVTVNAPHAWCSSSWSRLFAKTGSRFCEDWQQICKGAVKRILSHHPTIQQVIVDVYHWEPNGHLQAFKARLTMEGVNSIDLFKPRWDGQKCQRHGELRIF